MALEDDSYTMRARTWWHSASIYDGYTRTLSRNGPELLQLNEQLKTGQPKNHVV